ncbi:sulfite exporter TauE/SafE family protein [Pseudochelatococcus sp. G4_1912]|uniref:sulfite exporter TauE/SafE family protein n=1 Tax=Pseudochelatococcus sp. G4_1912 TaxID=3114288 RepID=UPI0039C716A8
MLMDYVGSALSQYAFWVIAIAFAGLLGGLLAGLLGVGGGIIIVPVLYQVFTTVGIAETLRMKIAVATSLATIIATSAVSVKSHYDRGAVDTRLLKSWSGPIFVGVIAGAIIGGHVDGRVLSFVFATVALLVALQMTFTNRGAKIWDDFPNLAFRWGSGAFVGLISALMGIGGGSLSVPILSAVGYDIRKAVGTAAAIGFIIAIPGTITYVLSGIGVQGLPPFSLGYLNWLGALVLVPLTMLTAPLGARLAHSIPRRMLQTCFAVFLAITSARMFYDLLS